jgi:hypothetical protein
MVGRSKEEGQTNIDESIDTAGRDYIYDFCLHVWQMLLLMGCDGRVYGLQNGG